MKARIPKTMGGAQNTAQLVRQAQKMQDQITELQADIEARDFTATAGGGVVEVTLNGKKEIKTLSLKPEVVDPEDIETLQDLIIAAINEAVNNIENTTETEMGKITGGVSIPGMFN
ncbi:MAG: YbaB/EbfC family nucleoid-associated protein [Ruminococcus sp.]|nr:YbaB/EbfC family nucleoid-associated protein [Ruminococcus sp.]